MPKLNGIYNNFSLKLHNRMQTRRQRYQLFFTTGGKLFLKKIWKCQTCCSNFITRTYDLFRNFIRSTCKPILFTSFNFTFHLTRLDLTSTELNPHRILIYYKNNLFGKKYFLMHSITDEAGMREIRERENRRNQNQANA